MATSNTKLTVGLFVVGGLAIAMSAVIWLGMSNVFDKGNLYVTYFDESVQGLDIDSPVKYRGVPVGRVVGIEVAPDFKLIQVKMSIDAGETIGTDSVAQLKSVGITGSMFVELDRMPPGDTVHIPQVTFPAKYPVISSKQSDVSKVLSGFDTIVQQLKQLDLGSISDNLITTLDAVEKAATKLDKTVTEVDIASISAKLQDVLDSADEDMQALHRTISQLENATPEINEALQEVRQAISDAKTFLEEGTIAVKKIGNTADKGEMLVDISLAQMAELRGYLVNTARNIENASSELDGLMETLAAQPSQILFSAPPTPRPLDE